MIIEPVCFTCKHLTDAKQLKCKAFPEGIPESILFKGNQHKKPLKGQENQLVYEPSTEEENHDS